MQQFVRVCVCVIYMCYIYNVSIIISKKEAMNLRGSRVERVTQEESGGGRGK